LIHVLYGFGKGKTTSAIGMAVRFSAYGGKIFFVQFLKSSSTGERKVLSNLKGITLARCPENIKFVKDMDSSEFEAAKTFYSTLLEEIRSEIRQKHFQMLVLDEIFSLSDCKLIDESEITDIIYLCRDTSTELVMTAHTLPAETIQLCDYVTRLDCVKHPYQQGTPCRKGIEF